MTHPAPASSDWPLPATRNELDALFRAHADGSYARFTQAIIPSLDPDRIIGIRTPDLRIIAKRLEGTALGHELLGAREHRSFEEMQLHAFLIELLDGFDATVQALDAFLPIVDNWSTCDSCSPRIFKKQRDAVIAPALRWIDEGEANGALYMTRFGIGMLMRYYLDERFDPAHLDIVSQVHSGDYYLDMMVAWYFATALSKQWDATLPYLERRRLPEWTHAKAIQKARESRRITAERKTLLKRLR